MQLRQYQEGHINWFLYQDQIFDQGGGGGGGGLLLFSGFSCG